MNLEDQPGKLLSFLWQSNSGDKQMTHSEAQIFSKLSAKFGFFLPSCKHHEIQTSAANLQAQVFFKWEPTEQKKIQLMMPLKHSGFILPPL